MAVSAALAVAACASAAVEVDVLVPEGVLVHQGADVKGEVQEAEGLLLPLPF